MQQTLPAIKAAFLQPLAENRRPATAQCEKVLVAISAKVGGPHQTGLDAAAGAVGDSSAQFVSRAHSSALFTAELSGVLVQALPRAPYASVAVTLIG